MRSTVLAAAALLIVAVTPGHALAAATLTSGTAVSSTGVQESSTVALTTSYWSIVATAGYLGGQSDLALTGPGGAPVGRSADGFGVVDWVAVDTNAGHLPLGGYTAEVTSATDSGRPTTHLTQFVGGDKVLTPARPDAVVGFASGPWLADIRDISLQAGRTVTFTVRGLDVIGAVSVLRSTTDPATWSRTRATAALSVELPKPDTASQTYSFRYTAPATGWYGVVFEPRFWSQWVGQSTGGVGYVTVQ